MSSSSTVNTNDGENNKLERRSYTCHECDIIITILSSSSSSNPYCPPCNLFSSFSSSTLFEVGLDDFDENQEDETSQISISTVEISPSMLCSSSSEDSTLPCAICREDFVVGESVRKLPGNLIYHCDCIIPWLTSHNSCPLCRFELLGTASGDDGGLTMWFDVLALEDDLEEDIGVILDNLYQSFDG